YKMANFLTAVRTEDCAIVHATEENVKAFVNNNEVAAGKLIISESVMSWQKMDGQGLSLPYPAISLHAVSRDLNAFPHECLYLMIDPEKLPNDILGRINHEEMEGDEEEIVEIRFVPQNGSTLGRLFDALSECQLLHPDPADEDLSDDYVDAEEDQAEEAVGFAEEEMEQLPCNNYQYLNPPVMVIILKTQADVCNEPVHCDT
ncbi:putative methylosome subunit pICln-like isoform X1, partial [Apostichopus japonicus]